MEEQEQLRIELLQKIGEGAFGEVWVARLFEDEENIRYVAVKLERNAQ
jgi:hypothetical protein